MVGNKSVLNKISTFVLFEFIIFKTSLLFPVIIYFKEVLLLIFFFSLTLHLLNKKTHKIMPSIKTTAPITTPTIKPLLLPLLLGL